MADIPPLPDDDPIAAADQAAAELADLTGAPTHDLALVLGSGWLPAVDMLGRTEAEISSTQVHGFAPPAVAGHAGAIRSITTRDGRRALVFLGRTHFYEGRGVEAVVHGVRTLALEAGVEALGTAARLRALEAAGRIDSDLARDLVDALHCLMGLKLANNLRQIAAG